MTCNDGTYIILFLTKHNKLINDGQILVQIFEQISSLIFWHDIYIQ